MCPYITFFQKLQYKIIMTIVLVATVLSGGCSDVRNYLTGDVDAGEMPNLAQGAHLGFIAGFYDSLPAITQSAVEDRWDEAIASGMTIARVQFSWRELEPQPGVYSLHDLEKVLSDYGSQGLQVLLIIAAYDSESPETPHDLKGMKFDNPVLISRFKALMNEIRPLLEQHRVYAISIANEPDNSFGEMENLENEMLVFLKEIKSHIRSFNKKIAVTMTLAEMNYNFGKPGMLEIISESDVACWNFYGINYSENHPYFSVQGEAELIGDLQGMVDASTGKQIVLQEVGLHSGSVNLDSSEQAQRKFFETFFQFMQGYTSIRVAYVFQLVDRSPETAAGFLDPAMSEDYKSAYSEYLQSLGLLNYSDGAAKPAWAEFIYGLSFINPAP